MFDAIIAALIEKGIDVKNKTQESELLRTAVRERLGREVRLNLAMWNLPAARPRPKVFAAMVSMEAIEAVCMLNLPLRIVLDEESLSITARKFLDTGGEGDSSDGNFRRWAAGITSEVILVERIWHRLRVLKFRQVLDGSLGNLAYLMHLHRAMEITLQPERQERCCA